MESMTHLQTECVVSGTFYFILHISRLAGASPVKFERVNGGWRIRVSWIAQVYSVIVQITLLTLTGICALDREEVEDGYESSNNTGFMRIALIIHLLVHCAVGGSITATGPERMRSTIDCTALLQQINVEMAHLFGPARSNEKTMCFVLIFSMLFGYYAVSFEYGVYLTDVLAADGTVTYTSVAFSAVFLCLLQIQLFSTQFWAVTMHLVSTQKRLNNYLKSVLEELRKQSSETSSAPLTLLHEHVKQKINLRRYEAMPNYMITYVIDLLPVVNGGLKTDPDTLDRLIDMYCSMCGMIRQLNDSNGPALLTMLMFLGTYMMTAPYFVVATLFRINTHLPAVRAFTVLSWCLLCFGTLVMSAEPCHQSQIQLWKTKRLIRHMRRYTPSEGGEASDKLNMFYRHIQLNPVRFAPLELLTFNRSLLIAVLSTIVTYLSVIIHL